MTFDSWAAAITPQLERHAAARLRNHDPDLAGEAVQRTLISLWRSWPRLRVLRDVDRTRIAHATVARIARSCYAELAGLQWTSLEQMNVHLGGTSRTIVRIDLARAVQRLPEAQRQLCLRMLDGLTESEVQAEQGWWYGRCRYLMAAARARLQKMLRGYA